MDPGFYSQPLPRKIFVNVPAISGYVASRLHAGDAILPNISGEDTTCMVTFENVGVTAVSVRLRQTSDRSISGTRTTVTSGDAGSLVPGGRVTRAVQPFKAWLELYCYAGGPSSIRMQLESKCQWEECGFDDTDDATFYPTSLWQAKAYPPAPAFPS